METDNIKELGIVYINLILTQEDPIKALMENLQICHNNQIYGVGKSENTFPSIDTTRFSNTLGALKQVQTNGAARSQSSK